ncbi:hypothetical protein ACFQJD_15315 [Haloplanus sp. GCM10025708]|uniref:hypothetical protein n=1 Tax=Haloplanus sp. GCM10025708 TaxID=3252679 RepID=UPI00360B02BB
MRPRTLLTLRPTLRGVVVAAVAAGSLWMAAAFGARSLNAIVVPAAVALLGAGVSLLTLDRPTLTRSSPPSGFPGDERTVTLAFDTDDPFVGVVVDDLPDGVDGDARVETLVGDAPVSYEVTYRTRGVHDVGPVRVRARDVLGLAERTFAWDDRSTALVYPRVYPSRGPPSPAWRRASTSAPTSTATSSTTSASTSTATRCATSTGRRAPSATT